MLAETEKIFRGLFSCKLPQDIHRVAARKLEQLHAATMLATLRVPSGNRLAALTYHRQGQPSIRVNDEWRVCFVWRDGDAYDVEIVDHLETTREALADRLDQEVRVHVA